MTPEEIQKLKEAEKSRRPNYREIAKCCSTCNFVMIDHDGCTFCTHGEKRKMKYDPRAKLDVNREAMKVKLQNAVLPYGVCDAWEEE
jgi:hypothetical protein